MHKVDSKKEAIELFKEKKYHPMYIQDTIDLKDSGDIRVMLIGHKPVCAFWRYSGEGQWITNTSQGGSMSYENVPMNALELAVEASKAAKAEYWACDIAIDKKDGKAYILECATAFAAFPYIRDWIGRYIMWDLSNGYFSKPNVPLYSWEELGKISSNLLRRMRHIDFSSYTPSVDGVMYVDKKDAKFPMQQTQISNDSDIPQNPYFKEIKDEDELPDEVKQMADENEMTQDETNEIKKEKKIDLNSATLTELISLHGMEEDLAQEIIKLRNKQRITSLEDLLKLNSFDSQFLEVWREKVKDMRIKLDEASEEMLQKVKGISKKLSTSIIAYRDKIGGFTDIDELQKIKGIGKRKLKELKEKLRI